MNPVQSGIPSQRYTASINSGQSLAAAGPQAQAQHSPTLSLAGMSRNTLSAFDHTNQTHEPLAMRAINLIADSALGFQSAQGADARYATANGDLTVHARLNEQSRYDVISISSPNVNPIYLSVPPPPANPRGQTSSVSSHLAMQYSPGQLTQALIRQKNPQDFSGAPLASDASASTQPMVFSDESSVGASTGVTGPSRTQPVHAARSRPYPASSLSSLSGGASEPRMKRPGATNDQINASLRNEDGSLRTRHEVASALHAAGLGAGSDRILAQLQAVVGRARLLPSATDDQIKTYLRNDDGSLKTHKGVASALHAVGLGARDERIQNQLQAVRGARRTATDEQIKASLRNDDGAFRSRKEIASALRAAGLEVGDQRIQVQLQAAGGAQYLPGATDDQINACLRDDDGSLRVYREVASVLRADGLGASAGRIRAQLQAAGGARLLPGATADQINANLRNDDGSLRTRTEVSSALHAAGLGAGSNRILTQLQKARAEQEPGGRMTERGLP